MKIRGKYKAKVKNGIKRVQNSYRDYKNNKRKKD